MRFKAFKIINLGLGQGNFTWFYLQKLINCSR